MHQRAWDLLRQMRGHLVDEGLISAREYAWLVSEAPGSNTGIKPGSPAVRRLETYDEMRDRLSWQDEAALVWKFADAPQEFRRLASGRLQPTDMLLLAPAHLEHQFAPGDEGPNVERYETEHGVVFCLREGIDGEVM